MTFLSRTTIAERLSELIPNGIPSRIKNSAYELGLGAEAFTTDQDLPKELHEADTISIGAGQFALLVTEETVTVPPDLLGFLSVKFKKKIKGLINVSGFHVDPGYQGRIIFAVYNAGTHELILRQGEELFLIWFAQLDRASDAPYGDGYLRPQLPTAAVNDIKPYRTGGRPVSLATLDSEMRILKTRVDSLMGLGLGLLGLFGVIALDYFFG